ncbi:unnamed protein product [Schistocephalus solidus]|uniref:PI31_Prot_N domain-containing protein n=1 Tax=Schistocephalus solidus TaxID=70667 RepID=A0A183TB70_SCHSO|nr:unnamed protein product [Schistocephalus solidus]
MHHSVAIHRVNGFRQIHEFSVEAGSHLLALLFELASGKNHVGCATVPSEATLAFRKQSLLQVTVLSIEKDTGEDLPGDVKQPDSLVVFAEFAAPFDLVEMDDRDVFEILRDLFLAPHRLEELGELAVQVNTYEPPPPRNLRGIQLASTSLSSGRGGVPLKRQHPEVEEAGSNSNFLPWRRSPTDSYHLDGAGKLDYSEQATPPQFGHSMGAPSGGYARGDNPDFNVCQGNQQPTF